MLLEVEMETGSAQRWQVKDAAQLYGIKNWGAGYFDLDKNGNVIVCTQFDGKSVEVNLVEVVKGLEERGNSLPVLLRIENLLDSQITKLNESFRKAITDLKYQNIYQGVFPIKVNQQQHIIQEIANYGERYRHGLEAGSKAELIVAMAMIKHLDCPIVCNGYKDGEFIDLALQATKIGHRVFIVVEMPGEMDLILERSEALGVRPNIGIRVKIASKAGGHWGESGGDRSRFGLSTAQVVQAVDNLRSRNYLDCLKLVHYHIGSQVPNIRDIRTAVRETARFYASLVHEGAPMGYVDLGGGLAVDYDGSKSNDVHSMNYNLDEYCYDVVEVLKSVFDELKIAHPTILTESGRATVAYSTLLLFDILDVNRFEPAPLPDPLPANAAELIADTGPGSEDVPAYTIAGSNGHTQGWTILDNMLAVLNALKPATLQECYNDAMYYRDEAREAFKQGKMSLRQRALADDLYWAVLRRIDTHVETMTRVPPELASIRESLIDIYYGNFSVFQSLPDSWAIGQLFPVMPLHRNGEAPRRNAVLADITCDSDGKIDRFPDETQTRRSIPVHELRDNEPYYMGVFMVGAYQETLGDLHNLFGDPNVVSIRINADGSYDFVREIEGDSIADVLTYVEYSPDELMRLFREKAEQAVRDGRLAPSDRRVVCDAYEASLNGYTYYER